MRALVATLCVAIIAACSVPAFAADPDQLFAESTAAAKEGNFQVAYEKMKEVWRLRPSYDVAANLAFYERKLGKTREAAEHLELALSQFPVTGEPVVRDRMKQDLDALRAELGRVEFDVPSGTIILVDGEERGKTPLKPAHVYVTPGKHTFEARRPGQRGSASIDVATGQATTVTIPLSKYEGDDDSGDDKKNGGVVTTPDGSSEGIPLWSGIVVGGLGLAGIGAGIGLAVVAGSSGSSADEAAAALPSRTACQGDAPHESCASIADDLETRDLLSNASMGAFIAGGILVAGGATLIGLSAAGVGGTENAAFVPWIGPGVAGATFAGSF
ncbi:MAG: hypothetical protein HOV80_36055 [Polyangiaceae bacterium]|nr:hypothetical protein [Polyangiaceae bacterium]